MKTMYGLTHTLEGVPIVREAKTLKVGIGLPKGKAVHVWIAEDGQWCIQAGNQVTQVGTREEAEEAYHAARSAAPERRYPGRLSYFTFSNVGADGSFEPDFEAIETYGSMPRQLDIVFVEPDPFDNSFQMWTATELKCEGDGRNAKRVVTLAGPYREEAGAAMARGDKRFDITDGCWMFGCPFAGEDCKPHGRLVFQLARTPRLGSTAYFDTTGFKSVGELFSSLQKLLTVTGHGVPEQGRVHGIPLKLCMRPYKVTYEERGAKKSGTQNVVWVEFRANDALALKRELLGYAAAYEEAPRQLTASTAEPLDVIDIKELEELETVPSPPPMVAAALAAEFYPERENEDDEFRNGGSEASTLRMPQRKPMPLPEPSIASPSSTPSAAETTQQPEPSEAQPDYLTALEARKWQCRPAQKQLVMRKVAAFLEAGGTPEDVKRVLVETCSVESPAQLGGDMVGRAMTALQQIIGRPTPPRSEPTKREMNQAAVAAQAPARQVAPESTVRRVVFE